MLARAIALDLLVKQVNMSEMNDGISFQEQVDRMTQIIEVLEKDKVGVKKWSGLTNKMKVAGSKDALKTYLPELKKIVA